MTLPAGVGLRRKHWTRSALSPRAPGRPYRCTTPAAPRHPNACGFRPFKASTKPLAIFGAYAALMQPHAPPHPSARCHSSIARRIGRALVLVGALTTTTAASAGEMPEFGETRSVAPAGTITWRLTGTIRKICSIQNRSQVVPLGDISARQLSAPGAYVAAPFAFELTNCVGTTQVKVRFSGTAHADDPTMFALDPGSDSATGVGLSIHRITAGVAESATAPNHATPLVWAQGDGGGTLSFEARLRKVAGTIQAGRVVVRVTTQFEFL